MKTIEGMSILVTGGGSGIGTDCARRFCAQGARVTISGRRLENLQAVQTELGANCHIVQGDVTVQADREAMLSEAVKHGNDRLDALVNNAANNCGNPNHHSAKFCPGCQLSESCSKSQISQLV